MLQTTSIHYPSSFLPSHVSLIVVPFFFFLPHILIPTLTFPLVSAVLEALPHMHFLPLPNRPAPNPFRYYGFLLLLLLLLLTFPFQPLPLLGQLYWKHSPACISPCPKSDSNISLAPTPSPQRLLTSSIRTRLQPHCYTQDYELPYSVAIPLFPNYKLPASSFHSFFRSSESTIPHWLPPQSM